MKAEVPARVFLLSVSQKFFHFGVVFLHFPPQVRASARSECQHGMVELFIVRCILASVMSDYMYRSTPSLSHDVQHRKEARKKVIEAARKLERDSYKAMMDRRRRLQATSNLV